MYFELWDLSTGNMIDSFATEAAALALVRSLLATGHVGYLTDLALDVSDAHGNRAGVADGTDLAARALANTEITLVGAA
jgi:hypothetical protein